MGCCPDNRYCAATADDCPARLFPTLPKKLSVVKTTCGPDETECPAGCCPEANWFCCPDNMNCAATEDYCPFVAAKKELIKMASKKQCSGTECPAGCCPEANWFCCADNMNCAATEDYCPFVAAKKHLIKMAAKK